MSQIPYLPHNKMLSKLGPSTKAGEKCPHSELFWSAFSRIRTAYGEIRSISPYSVRMQVKADKNNSKYGHFSRSGNVPFWPKPSIENSVYRKLLILNFFRNSLALYYVMHHIILISTHHICINNFAKVLKL